MRALFTVSSWPTHYASMIPIGWALQAMGHEVRVLCADSQVDPVARAGLMPVPGLDGMDAVTTNRLQYYWEAVNGQWPFPWLPLHPITGAEMTNLADFDLADYRRNVEPELAARARHSHDEAVAFASAWQPDLVLHDPASSEGQLVGRVLNVPAALSLWGAIGTHEPEHMRVLPTDFSGSFHRYGLPAPDPDHIEYVVDPCPERLAPPTSAHRLAVRYEPYNGTAPVPRWLLEPPERPRICVAWSTALSTMSGPQTCILPELINNVSDLDADVFVLATNNDAAGLPRLPGNVQVVTGLPLRLLLPNCAAVVHHGGGGNTMTSVWSGVPQLMVTFASEQRASAERIAAIGSGRHLSGEQAQAHSVQTALRELMGDSSYHTQAALLQAEMLKRPSAVDLVAELEELALR